MKQILLLLFFAIPFISKSQIKDTSFTQIDEKFRKASVEMIKFDKQFNTGLVIELLGGVVLTVGSIPNVAINNNTPIIVAGGILTLAGFIIHAASTVHIRNAAIILRGNSLVIPLHRK